MNQRTDPEAADVPASDEGEPDATDFVRFCYRRRRVGWPELYDEMCAVAGRGLYRGYSADDLNGIGIGLTLFEMPALAAIVHRVVAEDQERRRRSVHAIRVAHADLTGRAGRSADAGGDPHLSGRRPSPPRRPILSPGSCPWWQAPDESAVPDGRRTALLAALCGGHEETPAVSGVLRVVGLRGLSRQDLGADLAAGHLAFDLALGLDVAVDLLAEVVRLGRVEVGLLLEHVRQAPARHPDVVEVLHQDERVHRRQVRRVVHLLHCREF